MIEYFVSIHDDTIFQVMASVEALPGAGMEITLYEKIYVVERHIIEKREVYLKEVIKEIKR